MNRTPIYNTPEYKLAPQDMQHWAFTHKGQYMSSVDAAKKMGVKLTGRKTTVKTNTGAEVDVELEPSYYDIKPTSKYKQTYAAANGKDVLVYMVKGSSPKQKTAQYFTYDDLKDSKGFADLKQEMTDAFKKYHEEHREMVKSELAKSHSPMAKKALKELPELLKDGDDQVAYDWFKKNGFDMGHSKPENFKNFVKDAKKSGAVATDWYISQGNDQYGHTNTVGGKIDFDHKKIGIVSGSSA